MSKKQKVRELKSGADFRKEKTGEKRKMSANAKQCPHCGGEMKARGSGDACGGHYWKCKNKRCGRTVWKHKVPLAPEPLVYVSTVSKFY